MVVAIQASVVVIHTGGSFYMDCGGCPRGKGVIHSSSCCFMNWGGCYSEGGPQWLAVIHTDCRFYLDLGWLL